jgi:probable blue pigment (indigoidine) exporter
VVAVRGLRGRGEPLALAAWQMTAGGAALAVAGVALEDGPSATGPRELALVVGLAALCSAAPLALFYLALARGSASEVSAWFFLVPVVGVASAWPLLGEAPTGRLAVGLVAVSVGLWLMMRARVRAGGRLVDSAAPS